MNYDVIIVGGGLGGLISSIQLAKKQYNVLVVEKYAYPFNKVCGEYVSNEVKPFLEDIGLDLTLLGATNINRFQLTSIKGKSLETTLQMGGFGLSRYTLDNELYKIAKSLGVTFLLNTFVDDIQKINETFFVETNASQTFETKVVIGSYGKRGKLDKSLFRQFPAQKQAFIGVKYHIKYDFPKDLIALHNFNGGYCGISAIEDDKYCLCYLSDRNNVKQSGGVHEMELDIMCQNPFLSDIFQNAEFLFDRPLVINEIIFTPKSAVHKNILMVGDTAGLITPLAGNGMSIAIRAGVIASKLIGDFLQKKINREELEGNYTEEWNKNFKNRLWRGRQLQKLFGDEFNSNLAISTLKKLPFLLKPIIKATHGKIME
ncbi:NAD(P)/FAD-dependent oxidoreductase [Emticicia sp. W12TSBA100-4]|uniref:NAD(P)/FAD-dependent oxidoreductase n=1 Tax=Emticicia sp. W12TSBA100-4 TaxID=3160965 RepID=UPI0033067549